MPSAHCGAPCSVSQRPEPGGQRLWWALCLALALPTLALNIALRPGLPEGCVALDTAVADWPLLARSLVMRPDVGIAQPAWVWWSTTWLHGSQPHLLRNLAGLGLVALLGWLIRPTRPTALAAWLAWPLTQLGMLMQPTLASYVGLSGVLHACVVVLAWQAATGPKPQPMPRRALHPTQLGAWALLIGLAAKVLMENPWGDALVASAASAINVAPWAHLSGCAAGVLSTWVLAGGSRLAQRCH